MVLTGKPSRRLGAPAGTPDRPEPQDRPGQSGYHPLAELGTAALKVSGERQSRRSWVACAFSPRPPRHRPEKVLASILAPM